MVMSTENAASLERLSEHACLSEAIYVDHARRQQVKWLAVKRLMCIPSFASNHICFIYVELDGYT